MLPAWRKGVCTLAPPTLGMHLPADCERWHTGTFPFSQPQMMMMMMMMEISISSRMFRSKQSQLLIAATSGQRQRRMAPYQGKCASLVLPLSKVVCSSACSSAAPHVPGPKSGSARCQSSVPTSTTGRSIFSKFLPFSRRVCRDTVCSETGVTPGDVAPHIVTGINQITAAELRGICLLKIA